MITPLIQSHVLECEVLCRFLYSITFKYDAKFVTRLLWYVSARAKKRH